MMFSVTFRVHYATQWGESLFLELLNHTQTHSAPVPQQFPMNHEGDGFWSLQLQGVASGSTFQYRYEFRDAQGASRREPVFRRIELAGGDTVVWDHFLPPELPEGAFLRQAFAGVIFNPSRTANPPLQARGRALRLTIRAPRVSAGQRVCVSGGHPLLGNWAPKLARVLSGEHYPRWELELPLEDFPGATEFKFGLWDERQECLVEWEQGPNRIFHGAPPGPAVLVVNYEHFQHAHAWRGAGVAIPVFSLRTERGYGIGEFADLAPFAEWAAHCHLHLVQLLPVNDTCSDFTWRDSYPYKAISTAALHPIYLNIDQVFNDCGVPLPPEYAHRRSVLNRLTDLDYEAVLKDKLDYLRQLFARVGEASLTAREFDVYLRENDHWLKPYAAFCRLRDLHRTAEFQRWGEYANFQAAAIEAWFQPGSPEYLDVMFYCWVQFHLDRQLAGALAAGHARTVAFKGDLPIGIDRNSVEAWTQPNLFQMDRQTGAPPDAFAVLGQNWGFPTYNWARMEADGYAWWRRRFQRMSAAFDALRVDHILGFFRIWEIPFPYREGIMGHYNPALPLDAREIACAGFGGDPRQFATGNGPEDYEVLFVEDPDQPGRFHPRINLCDAARFLSLPKQDQAALRKLHDDFYHCRHTKFWADEAMKKLPVLMDASSMLICGEDLGMVPESVPLVLRRLGLLSLEVQRWPKQLGQKFGNPADYPYLSVCTTSTHDMSTIRGWWEEEAESRRHFWREVMRRKGAPPSDCSPDICRFIVEQNLAATSMWCVLQLQDWLSIDPSLRRPNAAEERINIPAVPRHYWRYRMHLSIEALSNARELNDSIRQLVKASGRGASGE